MSRLTDPQWEAIRSAWEYSPDEPSYQVAGEKAAQKHGFKAPSKQAIMKRAKSHGWERKASLAGVNQAAHRRADRLVESDGSKVDAEVAAGNLKKQLDEREESERKRAEVRARHRTEWQQVAALRQEALNRRQADSKDAFDRLKIAKITAEITAIQQRGECVAWGLDELIDPARLSQLSDEQLEALAAGKSI